MNSKKYISTALLFVAAIIWGFAFAAQDAASDMGAFTLGFARSIVAGIFLVGVVILFDKITHSERKLFSKNGIDVNKTEIITLTGIAGKDVVVRIGAESAQMEIRVERTY